MVSKDAEWACQVQAIRFCITTVDLLKQKFDNFTAKKERTQNDYYIVEEYHPGLSINNHLSYAK